MKDVAVKEATEVLRAALQERRDDLGRCWQFTPEMTRNDVLFRYKESHLHILYFGKYELLKVLIEEMC